MSAPDLAAIIKEKYGINVKYTILGHIQRGGAPSGIDRILASRLGNYAVELLIKNENAKAVGIKNNKLVNEKLEKILKTKHKLDLKIFDISRQLSI